MKRLALVLLLALPAVAIHATDVPASLSGKWEVDVERSKVTPIGPNGDPLPARALWGHMTLDITTNTLSITTRPTMVIMGLTNMQCVAAAPSPAQATFRKTYRNGKSVEYTVAARGTNSLQFVSAPVRLDFLTAYIWRKRVVEHPAAHVFPKAASGL